MDDESFNWLRARSFALGRNGRTLTREEHDALAAKASRPLTDDPIRLRPGRDVVGHELAKVAVRGTGQRGAVLAGGEAAP